MDELRAVAMKSTVNEHQENLSKMLMKVFIFVDMESKGLMPQKNLLWRKKTPALGL